MEMYIPKITKEELSREVCLWKTGLGELEQEKQIVIHCLIEIIFRTQNHINSLGFRNDCY